VCDLRQGQSGTAYHLGFIDIRIWPHLGWTLHRVRRKRSHGIFRHNVDKFRHSFVFLARIILKTQFTKKTENKYIHHITT